MAVGDTRIVLNSVGAPVEVPATDSAALPMGEFSKEQAALAGLSMPFRKIIRDPYMCGVGIEAVTTDIDADGLRAKRCTAFHAVNPNNCYVRLRGATGPDDHIADGEGWLWPPGFVGVYSTQYPDFVSAIAVERPGFPIRDEQGNPIPFVPIELAYGIGG